MSEEELEKRIKEANEEFLSGEEAPTPETPTVDLYQQNRDARRVGRSKAAYGTRPYVHKVLEGLANSPVVAGFRKAQDDIKNLKSIGDKQRAEMVRQQYMEDYYMPAVDAAVRLSTKQDVLSSKEILDTLDEYVILPVGKGKGYTATFISQMYEDGGAPAMSDDMVRGEVKKIIRLCMQDEIATAVAAAKRIKRNIDEGRNIAIPEDYDIIQKVAIRGEA